MSDSRNKAWADSEGLGKRLLRGMGWKEGEGLGKNAQGRTSNVRVERVVSEMGLGFDKARREAESDATTSVGALSSVLKDIKAKVPVDASAGAASSEEPAQSVKRKRRDSSSSSSSSSSSYSSEPEHQEEEKPLPRRRPRYQKFKNAKRLSNFSEEDVLAVLGKATPPPPM